MSVKNREHYHKSRPGSTGGSRSLKNRRRKARRQRKIAMITTAAVLIIAVSGFIFIRTIVIDKDSAAVNSANGVNYVDETPAVTIPETAPERELYVEGINIKGLSREEVRQKLMQLYPWALTLTLDKEEVPLTNLLAVKIDQLTAEVFSSEADNGTRDQYMLDLTDLEDLVNAEVEQLAGNYLVEAQNGTLVGIDSVNGGYQYASEANGRKVRTEQLSADILKAINDGSFDRKINVEFDTITPERTKAQAKEQYKAIGSFTTKTTANAARNTNIRLASEAVDGTLIKPGEEFSFNHATGNRTTDKGYKPAGAYVNGILVEEPGGGVCQVSTTLFNAVVLAGVEIVERNFHSYAPSYVNSGEDAMVSYDGYAGPDLRFLNNTGDNLMVRAKYENQTVTISLIGIPVLEPGVTVKMKSEKLSDTNPSAPTYEEDQSLQPGVEVVVTQPMNGSRWETKLLTMKDGQVISEEYFHRSTYKGKGSIIKRNTSGVVIPKETQPAETVPTESQPSELPTEPTVTAPDEQVVPGPNPLETSPTTPPATEAVPGPGAGPGVTETTPSEAKGPGVSSTTPGGPAESE